MGIKQWFRNRTKSTSLEPQSEMTATAVVPEAALIADEVGQADIGSPVPVEKATKKIRVNVGKTVSIYHYGDGKARQLVHTLVGRAEWVNSRLYVTKSKEMLPGRLAEENQIGFVTNTEITKSVHLGKVNEIEHSHMDHYVTVEVDASFSEIHDTSMEKNIYRYM